MLWKKKEKAITEGLAWFSYSIMLPDLDEGEEDITVVGNMIIKNIGTTPLNEPMVCIRIKPPQDARLGGKIGSMTHTALMVDGTNTEAWHYFHDNWQEQTIVTGEHWLKPNHIKKLEPGENLTFANELRILTKNEEKFVLVEGFFYSNEIKNGIATLNKITINF